MKKFSLILATLVTIFSLGSISTPVYATGACSGGISDPSCNDSCSKIGQGTDLTAEEIKQLKDAAGCNTDSSNTLNSHLLNIINVAISIVGIIAVVVIVMGGQRYVTSAGDPGKTKSAKDMILYAVVALVVAGLAFAIVNFVSNAIKSDTNTGANSSATP